MPIHRVGTAVALFLIIIVAGTGYSQVPDQGGGPGQAPGQDGRGSPGRNPNEEARAAQKNDGPPGAQGGGWDPSAAAERFFRRYDQNGDGLLNYDEMPDGLKQERDRWDTNRD